MAGRECRICLEACENDLIAPCMCTGSSRWVHRGCLDTWRATKLYKDSFTHCSTCKFKFRLHKVATEHPPIWQLMRYRFLVARDLVLVLCQVLVIIAVIMAVIQFFFPLPLVGFCSPGWFLLLVSLGTFLGVLGALSMLAWLTGRFPQDLDVPEWFRRPQWRFGGVLIGGGWLMAAAALVVFVALGAVVSVVLAISVGKKIARRHWLVRWQLSEVKRLVVIDLANKDIAW